MNLVRRLLGRTRRDADPMPSDTRAQEAIAEQRPKAAAALRRSDAALAIVRELEERLARDAGHFYGFERRRVSIPHEPDRRRTARR
jgi:hypothetical protein